MESSVPALSLIVVTRDRADLFARVVLPSIARADLDGVEVLVVDQSAGSETRGRVDDTPGIRYLRGEPPLSRGRNFGAAASLAPLIAFTDDNVEFEPAWPQRVRAVFDSHPDAGAVCGTGIDSAGRRIVGSPPSVHRGRANPWHLSHGFNLHLRRSALDAVGPFDERLGAGSALHAGEDTDMLWRVLRAGWPVVCDDTIGVIHHNWRHGEDLMQLHRGYGTGAGAHASKHLFRGDLALAPFAAAEIARHTRWMLACMRTSDRETALRHLAWLRGFASGFARGPALARERAHPRTPRTDAPRGS